MNVHENLALYPLSIAPISTKTVEISQKIFTYKLMHLQLVWSDLLTTPITPSLEALILSTW